MMNNKIRTYCTGCGMPAEVVTSEEGTSYFQPIYDARKTAVVSCFVCGRSKVKGVVKNAD